MKPRKVFKVGQGHLGGALGPDSVHKLLSRVEEWEGLAGGAKRAGQEVGLLG